MFRKVEASLRWMLPLFWVAAGCGSSTSGGSQPVTYADAGTRDDAGQGADGQPSAYERKALVSDARAGGGAQIDENLVNPWGIAYGPDTVFWIANNGSGTATAFDKDGRAQGRVVDLPGVRNDPGKPTGVVYNGSDKFEIQSDNRRDPARLIFATEQGTLLGWSADVDATRAVVVVDRSSDDAVYKGLAIAKDGDQHWLYATNFKTGEVDVFDEDFKRVAPSDRAFVDPEIPEGYAPFGIQAIEDQIYVTYAEQDDNKEDDVSGKGKGYVSVFEPDGTFIARVAEKGSLNAPWAVVRAPKDFGSYGGALLIGNFGDGRISAFDAKSYEYLGQLADDAGKPIEVEGLWGLVAGNGKDAGDTDVLYYTAGPGDEDHGIFGSITLR